MAGCPTELIAGVPEGAGALRLLALNEGCQGNYEAAVSHLRRALESEPDQPVWLRDLAVLLAASGRWAEARQAAQDSLDCEPGNGQAQLLLARALLECGEYQQALAEYTRIEETAENSREDLSEVLYGMSRALLATARGGEAADTLRRSIALNPASAKAHELLAGIYRQTTAYDDEYEHRQAVAQLRPGDAAALAQLGVVQWETGRVAESVATLRQALRIAPEERYVHSTLLHSLLHDPSQSGPSLRDEHTRWNSIHSLPRSGQPHPNSPDPDRRLRVGYLSGEFMENPSCFFLLPIVKRYDPRAVETFGYHTRPLEDSVVAAYRDAFHQWRDVHGQSDEEIAAAIRRDEIDILVDTSGHFPYHGLAVFSLGPAPVQATFANYPCTTGVSAFDYIFTDQWTCPPGSSHWYVEQPWRLPSGYFAWEPAPGAPGVTGLPARRNGAITFGLFQRPSKLNSGVWDAVAAVLGRVAGSALLIHQGVRDLDLADGKTRARYTAELQRRGIAPDRIRFRGGLVWRSHMELLSDVDIALDTFPYNGQTTTCECLWMGVPVVTLAGDSHASRVGASILHRAGHAQWIANSTDEYVDIAVGLAGDAAALEQVRANLRDAVANSPIARPERVARDIESAYRSMWRRWCAGRSGQAHLAL